MDFLDGFLDLLSRFVGGRQGSQHDVVRFGLAALFWLPLLVIAFLRQRSASRPREKLLLIGFGLGFLRDGFMLVVSCLVELELVEPERLHVFFPPLEHTLSSSATMAVAAAFLGYLLRDPRAGKRFLVGCLAGFALVYLATFGWWAEFITEHPERKFGHTWCDWVFHSLDTVLLLVPISILALRTRGWLRNAVCLALTMFLLDDVLKLVDLAFEEQYKTVFGPVRHAFHVFAIPIFGYVYIREFAEERTALERQSVHEERLKSLGVLATGIAHDFNNLLTVILNCTHLARKRLRDQPEVGRHLDSIQSAVERSSALTRQLLDYSGQGGSHPSLLDPGQLLERLRPLLRAAVPSRVRLAMSSAKELPAVEVDRGQLEQVLLNLVSNAADSIGEEGGKVSVFVSSVDCSAEQLRRSRIHEGAELEDLRPGPHVLIEVRDTGSGMDEETARRIFEPYFTTKFHGRGLGMASVAGILRAHGAVLLLHTEPGRGSQFQVLLPVTSASSPEALDSSASLEPAVSPDPGVGSGLVMVVDDEPELLVSLVETLESMGHGVIPVPDGVEAVRVFVADPEAVDLVILDMTLPGLDGRQTLAILRTIRPSIPVLLSSGYSDQGLEGVDLDGERTRFLPKPYGLEELSREVERLRARSKSAPSTDPVP